VALARNGAGHFVKMVHNGIEYGLMQAYAEGFDILKNAGSAARPQDERFNLDIADIPLGLEVPNSLQLLADEVIE
jgi:6-phosphogluconate dehydrogenase (decarboxylating)